MSLHPLVRRGLGFAVRVVWAGPDCELETNKRGLKPYSLSSSALVSQRRSRLACVSSCLACRCCQSLLWA